MRFIDKISITILHGLFILLMIMSIFFFKERLFADSAYFFFHSVNEGWFHIEHGRLMLGFSQIIPIIGSHLGLPLKYLMVLYSFGVELLYYLIFLFLLFKMKDKASAISLLLIHLVGQLWLFFVPSLEICHGAAMALIFYSIISSGKYKDDKWLIILLLTEWLVLFSHPANLILIPFLIGLDYLNRGWQKKVHVSTALLFVVGFVIRLVGISSYDQAKLENSNLNSTQADYGIDYWIDVFQLFVAHYPDLLILLIISIIALIVKRNKNIFLYLFTLVVLFVLVSFISAIDQFHFYTEAILSPVVFVVVCFFMFEVWKGLTAQLKSIGLVLIVLISVGRIYAIKENAVPLKKRTKQLARLVDYAQTLGHSKYLVNEENFKKDYSRITWANPIETLLLSSSDGNDQSLSIATIDDLEFEENKKNLSKSNFMLRRFDIVPLSDLNEAYFKLDEENYKLLNTNDFELPYESFKTKVKISPYKLNESIQYKAGDTSLLTVLIQTPVNHKLPSDLNGNVFIAYHWYKDGVVYDWDGLRTPLEVDVHYEYVQDVRIAMPKEAGNYEIQYDIVIEGKAWFGLQGKSAVIIN